MTHFVDTSALYAVLDADDANHGRARAVWSELLADDEVLNCTNYVLLETTALVQRRLGMGAAHAFHTTIVPLLEVAWVDAATHRSGVAALLTADRRQLSLVDCTSFEAMRRLGLTRAFAFDPHFAEQGFEDISG